MTAPASYTFANATTNYADAAAQAKYESITGIAVRIRCKGDTFTNLAAYSDRVLVRMANRGGFGIGVGHDGNDGSLRFYMEDSFQGTYQIDTSTIISSLSTSSYYVLVLKYATGAGGFSGSLYDSGGSLVVSANNTGANIQNAGAGNGAIRIGNNGTTSHLWTCDAVAVYSSTSLTTEVPTTGDTNILGLYKFDEGSGTSVADATGGTSLTIAGSGTWNTADGAWDGSATTAFRPYYITG